MAGSWRKVWFRGLLFGLLSASAVCLTFGLGRTLWHESLPGWAQHIFWPASAINLAGLLWLGWRYFPWIWLGAPAAVWVLGEPIGFSFVGATGNVIEALVGYLILRRIGRFMGAFDSTRTVLALMAASFFAPIPSTAIIPLWLFLDGTMDFPQFWMAIWNWNFSNGGAIILLTPFLRMVGQWPPALRERSGELSLGLAALVGITLVTFGAVFRDQGMNFAFLIFPVLILVAVRLGPGGVATGGAAVMGSVYAALIFHAAQMEISRAPGIIWFTQAFCWVLAATGLLVAALVAERQEAQRLWANAKARALESSLREERARLDALRYQINPHFLFNALNSLRSTFPLAAEVSREMVTELAGYLRSTLTRPEADLATVQEEVESVRLYLAIEQKRFGDELVVEIGVDSEVKEMRVPIFLLQPLVENAIRHGFAQSKGVVKLQITARLAATQIILEVGNTGQWSEPEPRDRPGLGLENIRRRLRLLYGENAALTLSAEDGWVRGRIELPRSVDLPSSIS